MKGNRPLVLAIALTSGLGGVAATAPVDAAMFDFMNPGRWFGNDYDRYDRYDRYGRYGPYGYGGGPYGYGGGPYGWGGPYGYGGGPWGGWGSYPGYGPGSTIVVTPQSRGQEPAPAPRLPE